MRRSEREVTRREDIIKIINKCRVLRIAMNTPEGLYIVPVNFGFEEENGKFVFYVHSAKQGRKLDAIRENPRVCIESDCRHSLIEGKSPCSYSYGYASIIASGTACEVCGEKDKIKALRLIMKRQTGKNFDFTAEQAKPVCIIKITAEEISAKANDKN